MEPQVIPEYTVRKMILGDVDQVLAIWKETGLSCPDGCLATNMAIDPEGMIVASTADGFVLGCSCAVFIKEDFVFSGLYVVRKEYRGKGIGRKVFQASLDHVIGKNNAGNSTETHLSMYRDKLGYKIQSGIISLECVSTDGQRIIQCCYHKLLKNAKVKIVAFDTKSVVQYDAKIHGYSRELLVSLTLQEPDCFALTAVDHEAKVKGYGMIRKDIGGMAILGPLYADDQETAEYLIRELATNYEAVRDNGLVIMALKSNPGSVEIIEKLDLKVTEVYERVFTKEIVNVPDQTKVYAQFSLDFCNF